MNYILFYSWGFGVGTRLGKNCFRFLELGRVLGTICHRILESFLHFFHIVCEVNISSYLWRSASLILERSGVTGSGAGGYNIQHNLLQEYCYKSQKLINWIRCLDAGVLRYQASHWPIWAWTSRNTQYLKSQISDHIDLSSALCFQIKRMEMAEIMVHPLLFSTKAINI